MFKEPRLTGHLGLFSSVSIFGLVLESYFLICSPAITTVGYGEITPTSFIGRLITLPLLLFGLLLIALPSFVLGREFSIVWENMTNKDNSPLVSFVPFLLYLCLIGTAADDGRVSRGLPYDGLPPT